MGKILFREPVSSFKCRIPVIFTSFCSDFSSVFYMIMKEVVFSVFSCRGGC